MCGRFTQQFSYAEVVYYSQLTSSHPSDVVIATPMRDARVICLDANGDRASIPMRWGWPASGPVDRPKHIHARAETIDTLPTFAESFRERRGILLVRDFNEGEETGARSKRQWVITPKDGQPLAIAVIWQSFTRGAVSTPMFVQATTPANTLITPITDRMPAILQPDDWEVWLGETRAPLDEVKALLRTFEDNGAWTMQPQGAKKTAAPPKSAPTPPPQGDLF